MNTTTKTIAELIESKESPLDLSVIPNQMGINLTSVDTISWTRRNDGELVGLTINFNPEKTNMNDESHLRWTGADQDAFEEAARPLVKWLRENPKLDPHHKVIVEFDGAELVSGEMRAKVTEFIKD